MLALLPPLAYDREQLMVAALGALVLAGAVVALGAWLLLFRQRHHVAKAGVEDRVEAAELVQVADEGKGEEPEG